MDYKSDKSATERIKVWQCQIDHIMFANNELRVQLATAISKDVGVAFLEEAEHFNHKFMEMDQIIELMRHEVAGLSLVNTEATSEKVDALFLRFMQDLERCEKEFHILETSFLNQITNLNH